MAVFGIKVPELDDPKYWIHIVVLTVIALIVLKYSFAHDMFNFMMGWKVALAIVAGDIFAHQVLRFNLKR